jgi:hypothetical protein
MIKESCPLRIVRIWEGLIKMLQSSVLYSDILMDSYDYDLKISRSTLMERCSHFWTTCYDLQESRAFLKIQLSSILIHILDMTSDYVSFRSLYNNNLYLFESRTCCQNKKNSEKNLDLLFVAVFFSYRCQVL